MYNEFVNTWTISKLFWVYLELGKFHMLLGKWWKNVLLDFFCKIEFWYKSIKVYSDKIGLSPFNIYIFQIQPVTLFQIPKYLVLFLQNLIFGYNLMNYMLVLFCITLNLKKKIS